MRTASLVEEELAAQLNLSYCRALEIVWLQRAAAASLPIWAAARWPLLPWLVTWLAFLAQGICLVMATAHGLLERRWSHRAALLEPAPAIATRWTPWDEVRAALWYGLAIVCVVPWTYVGLERALPLSLRSTLEAAAWAVLLLVAAAEIAASARPRPISP